MIRDSCGHGCPVFSPFFQLMSLWSARSLLFGSCSACGAVSSPFR